MPTKFLFVSIYVLASLCFFNERALAQMQWRCATNGFAEAYGSTQQEAYNKSLTMCPRYFAPVAGENSPCQPRNVVCNQTGLSSPSNPSNQGGRSLGDGMYRVAGHSAVYRIYGNGIGVCWVRDPGLVAAYGGKVEVIPAEQDTIFRNRKYVDFNGSGTQYCTYENGMYRRRDEAPVYRVVSSTICRVIDSPQVNRFGGWKRVFILPSAGYSDPFFSKTNTGDCRG